MKKVIFILLFMQIVSLHVFSYPSVECTPSDSAQIVTILSQADKKIGDEHPMLYFGKLFLGKPYVAHTLESGTSEHLIVNLREFDCTTFVETILALTLCHKDHLTTFRDFCNKLTLIRYRNGKMTDYTSRLHYFTWWAQDNEQLGLVQCIDSKSHPESKSLFTAIQKVNINYMSTHPQLYKHLKNNPLFVAKIAESEKESNGTSYPYIPKSMVGRSQSSPLGIIHDGDILAMLTSKSGLDTSHIGIAVWQNGHLHCLNVSAVYKKVVIDTKTFYQYQQVQTSQTGIRVFRVTGTRVTGTELNPCPRDPLPFKK